MPPSSSQVVEQNDHRAAARFDTALAVDVAGLQGAARNISASGIYFETDVEMPLGSLVKLNVQFTQGGRKHWLACEGKVVRVTRADGHHCIGAQLSTPFFSAEEEKLTAIAMPAKKR